MQPQPDQSGSSSKQPTTKIGQLQQQQQQHQSVSQKSTPTHKQVKIIKGKRPLCYFKFYLDICDHQLTKRIEEQIKGLGGNLEFFLTESVTHFITDKTVIPPLAGGQQNNYNSNNNNNSRPNTPQTPVTPNTPQTPYSVLEPNDARFASGATPIGTARRTRQSRADAILNRARRQGNNVVTPTTAATTPTSTRSVVGSLINQTALSGTVISPPYKIWQTEQALNFFKKITTELREYLNKGSSHKTTSGSKGNVTVLKGSYIKIEALKRNYRPYYHVLKKPDEWPKIDLSSDDGAFRLQPRQKPALITADASAQQEVMTRKSRTRSSQQLPQTKASNDTQLKQTPLPVAVESLKQPQRNNSKVNTATTTPNTTPHTPNCKEVKDSSDKQCGVCEICKIEYDTLTIHLKTKDHQYFAKNPANFIALDTLIKSTADVSKFLAEENITHHIDNQDPKAAEVEEMEVDDTLNKTDENIIDPLNDRAAITNTRSNSAESKRRPSPALREKSKRTTKGKHSSEKFQSNTLSAKQSPTKSVSPQKKPASSSMVELQRMDTVAVVNAATPTTTRRKTTPASALSPPIRAMLPPSSLYKVVETPEVCTPARSRRGITGVDCTEAVASPSIIVKFQKVRQNELQRLNGEAENFMFPKTRTSSELLTDIDRQTTSDRTRVSMSSTSLDSTSETDLTSSAQDSNSAKDFGRKVAIAKRRKGNTAAVTLPQRKLSTGSNSSSSRQRFQSAPIQPEVQLKSDAATASTITLPEATRKSSRTATAIVTKATASSRLVRAQVEAAKQTSRQQQNAKTSAAQTTKKTMKIVVSPPIMLTSRRRSAITVEKREDRMGEKVAIKKKIISESEESDDFDNETPFNDDDIDDEDEEDDDDDDDKNDADYVASKAIRKRKLTAETLSLARNETRDERAARRQTRLSLNKTVSIENDIALETSTQPTKAAKKLATPPAASKVKTPKKSTKSSSPSKGKQQKHQPAPHIFDYTKSEHLSNLTYAFECLPTTDLWHRVYMRQDAGEERYHTYFGLTRYRKLPYEMGPIPFKSTVKTSSCCALCNKQEAADTDIVSSKLKMKENLNTECEMQSTCTEKVITPQIKQEQTKQTSYKHKKLHLLQRYQQEQQAVLKQEVDTPPEDLQKTERVDIKAAQTATIAAMKPLLANTALPKCDSKASTPELMEREFAPLNEITASERIRADSTHSNTSSSYASSTASLSKKQYRNKHLNRLTELPPRKSPREHASTLALVSCMIRQRQDSLSKNNSEIDEAPTTPTPPTVATNTPNHFDTAIKQEQTKKATEPEVQPPSTPVKQKSIEPIDKPAIESPRAMRSAAATPIEELRFATEISENVKRMRRGQNKYDHSPPVVHKAGRPGRGRRANPLPLASTSSSTFSRRLVLAAKQDLTASVVLGKRKRREKPIQSLAIKHRAQYNSNHATSNTANGMVTSVPGVRKLGTKKGVLEYEFDNGALKRVDMSTQYTNPNVEAWLIDRYLELAGKEFDMEPVHVDVATATDDDTAKIEVETENSALEERITAQVADAEVITPPATDCFTSDFDLYDLLAGTQAGNGCCEDEEQATSRRNSFSFYSTTSLQSYYRKRKSLKSNRTGWPKAQKRKTTMRQQRLHDEKINFQKIGIGTELVQIKEEPVLADDDNDGEDGDEDGEQAIQDVADEAADKVQTKNAGNDGSAELEDDKGGGGGGGVITPPATDDDDEQIDADDDDTEPEDADVGADADDSLPEEDGTIADSIELDEEAEDNVPEADIEATDADVEEEADEDDEDDDNDDDNDDEFEDAYDHDANDVDVFDDTHTTEEPISNPSLHVSTNEPVEQQHTMLSRSHFAAGEHKILVSLLNSKPGASATSTPTAQSSRNHFQCRRTPQLNGSLGSCISPSEKLGDTSDIFTVSSDGLDTDLDVSNQHAQLRATDDDHMPHQCPHQTPKRKYDISKYAPSSAKASSCAAEAATAAAKSLAISQFLKKEVRVNCRRLRAPFRRFRYRR